MTSKIHSMRVDCRHIQECKYCSINSMNYFYLNSFPLDKQLHLSKICVPIYMNPFSPEGMFLETNVCLFPLSQHISWHVGKLLLFKIHKSTPSLFCSFSLIWRWSHSFVALLFDNTLWMILVKSSQNWWY